MSSFRTRNVAVLREAQQALNVAFGAILSAYIGNSLAEIDDRAFDHHLLARFFIGLGVFILGLCLGNSMILRGEYRLAATFLAMGAAAALFANWESARLGFEVEILRILSGCWTAALLGSNAVLTAITYFHYRSRR